MGISAGVLLAFAWFIVSLLTGCATAVDPGTNGVPNLSQVEPGVWRGGQPTSQKAWAYLRSLGLTNDIKLNTGEEASDRGAISAGFNLYYFPIDTMQQLVGGPDGRSVSNVVAMIKPGTFIHCEHGRDRTGLLVGLYRLTEGTNSAAAWSEMMNHGYHPALLGLTRYWQNYVKSLSPKFQSPKAQHQ